MKRNWWRETNAKSCRETGVKRRSEKRNWRRKETGGKGEIRSVKRNWWKETYVTSVERNWWRKAQCRERSNKYRESKVKESDK